MHYHLRILTKAESEETALDQTIAYADRLVDEDEFDYYDVYSLRYAQDYEGGRPRQITSELGRMAVAEALHANRANFERALHAARMMLTDFTDEQLYQEDYGDRERDYWPSRHQFAILAGETHDCFLYGDYTVWGGKIFNEKDLETAMRDSDPSTLWITSLDFHY